ncbi:MAG: HlyD family efflux transporter periplasmic adaptor subunit [Wenzhouxiangellaceae bacterium]
MDIVKPKKHNRKRVQNWLITGSVFIAVSLVIIGFTRMERSLPQVDSASILSDTVKRGEFLRQVRGPGVLAPLEFRWLAAASEARVEFIPVKPGAVVSADSVIIEMSSPQLQEAAEEADWNLRAAQSELMALRSRLESQRLDLESALAAAQTEYTSAKVQVDAESPLAQKGLVSQVQMVQSEARLRGAEAQLDIERERLNKFSESMQTQLETQQARVAHLKNTLQRRQDQVAALQVRAGIDGVVQEISVEEGEQVSIGKLLARVARPDVLIAELQIAETQAKDVQIGQQAMIDTRNGTITGEVMRVDPAVASGSVQIDVSLIGDLPIGARPDLSVDGTIEIERVDNTLYVGRPVYAEPRTTTTLFVIDSDSGIAQRREVQLGRSSVNFVEITSGLQVGERVILSDTSSWVNQDRIRIN